LASFTEVSGYLKIPKCGCVVTGRVPFSGRLLDRMGENEKLKFNGEVLTRIPKQRSVRHLA